MQRWAVVGVALVVATLTLASCGSRDSARDRRTGSIVWTGCGRLRCATLSVPLDAAHPDGAHIALALARRPASGHRVGVLLVNPGGPGASGVDFLKNDPDLFQSKITNAFDIVAWDPRGVGQSAPVQCEPALDEFYAINRDPQTPAQVADNVVSAKDFARSCAQRSGDALAHVSTEASARDMDAIRAAMDEPQISYYGFSYGTYLGSLYANLFPTHLRAAVLDGAIDPSLSYKETTVTQAEGFEKELDAFLAWCTDSSECGFAHGGDPRAAFSSLAHDLVEESIPAEVDGEHRTLGPGEFDIGVASALYGGEPVYPDLGAALAQAAQGNGEKVLRFSDAYTERSKGGIYSNETAALYATSCLDAPSPKTVGEVQAISRAAARVAPQFGPSTTWLGLPCTYWPTPAEGKSGPVHAPGAPPILVVGTTNDPATPYAWAQSLAHQLESGHLLTYEGVGHTAYGRGSSCIDDAVNDYVVKLTVPPDGLRC